MSVMAKEAITVLQQRLQHLGYYRLKVDGKEGPGTRNAVTEFKRQIGLYPRPKLGPLTLTALFSEHAPHKAKPEPVKGEPAWLTEARSLVGTKEVKGAGNNPIIMDWADELDINYSGDDVPWCGLFVAHCMNEGAPEEPQDFNRLGARAWLKYGQQVEPSVGSIGVFWRTHPTKSWHGHVAFLIGKGKDSKGDFYIMLGGNQSDNVTIAKIAANRLLQARAPEGFKGKALPTMSLAGARSQNEA